MSCLIGVARHARCLKLGSKPRSLNTSRIFYQAATSKLTVSVGILMQIKMLDIRFKYARA